MRRAATTNNQARRFGQLPAGALLLSAFFIAIIAIAQTEPPSQVAIPVQKPIPVILDTPLSTLNSKPEQIVTFHLTYSLLLDDGLEIPPNTKILGHVVEVIRTGHFDKQGVLRLAVDRMQLKPDGGTNLTAHLDPVGMEKQYRPKSEKTEARDAGGASLDSAVDSPTGAGTGGGQGTESTTGALLLMSPRGQQLYLEAGARFTVTLDQPASVSSASVRAAQQNFRQNPGPFPTDPDSQSDGMPKLKRRRSPNQ